MTPLVSVIIPAFNAGFYLAEAIESVFAQEYQPWEIVIYNDASTDGTYALLEEWATRHPERLRVVTGITRRGASAGRNRAIQASRGDWLALLDADDLWLPAKLQRQMELAQQGASWISALTKPFWSAEIPEAERRHIPVTQPLSSGPSAALFRRDLFEQVGSFDENMQHAEWIDWSMRASDEGLQATTVNEVLVRRRLHRLNKSRQASAARLVSLKASLDRRRQTNFNSATKTDK